MPETDLEVILADARARLRSLEDELAGTTPGTWWHTECVRAIADTRETIALVSQTPVVETCKHCGRAIESDGDAAGVRWHDTKTDTLFCDIKGRSQLHEPRPLR